MMSKDPLRIVHCFRSPVGGIFRHVRDLAEQHSQAGHQVGILCDSTTGSAHEDRLFEQIMPYLSLGLTRLPIQRSVAPSDLSAVLRSYKEISALQPDVLHGHGAKGGVVARVIGSLLRAKKYRVARFYSPHGGSLHFSKASLSGQAVFMAERLLERMTDGICFVCDYERETYQNKVGKPHCVSKRIYNGISDRDFGEVRLDADAVDLLYVGMLRDLKGPDVFIDAFAEAERIVGHPLRGMVVGDGPDEEKYRKQIEMKGLGRRISMRSAMPAREAFAKSDIVVVPSRAEAMPYIVLEALAAEKCLIASRVGGIPEILGADSAALVPPGSVADLARAMAVALTQTDWKRETMPKADAFRSRFSAAVMADEMETFYRARLSSLR